MAVALTGIFGLAVENLRALVAESSTFQTWTDTETAVAAIAHVFRHDAPAATEKAARPCAIVGRNAGATYRRKGEPSGPYMIDSGSLYLWFIEDTPAAYATSETDAISWMDNQTDGIIEDMADVSGNDSNFLVREFREVEPTERSPRDTWNESGDTLTRGFEVIW